MTLAELGRRTGYSAGQVSRLERGIAPLTDIAVLRRFAIALKIAPEILGLAPGQSSREQHDPSARPGPGESVKPFSDRGLVTRQQWNAIIRDATGELWLYGMAEFGYATDDAVPASWPARLAGTAGSASCCSIPYLRSLRRSTGTRGIRPARSPLGSYYSLPSETNKYTHVFLASPVIATGSARGDTEIERNFDMSVVLMPVERALSGIGTTITGMETVGALMVARSELR